jgi:hypothetical protein
LDRLVWSDAEVEHGKCGRGWVERAGTGAVPVGRWGVMNARACLRVIAAASQIRQALSGAAQV